MVWFAVASFALSAASAIKNNQADKTQAKAQQAWQAYSNQMANLSNANNQNVITSNQTMATQASAREAVSNQAAEIQATGSAEVAAAAAGVTGGSVAATVQDIERQAATVEYNRQEALKNQFDQFDQQRTNSTTAAAMQQNYSYIPKPSSTAMLLGIGAAGAKAGHSIWGSPTN